MVETEEAKKENRTKGMIAMSMEKFLNVYKDSDIYMVQDAIKPLSSKSEQIVQLNIS